MRKVCLVNNFNYARYLDDCLRSIEVQTTPFDVVVIVDDGSSDHSREIIASYCERLPGWHAVLKSNGGQLSCFNACRPYVAVDDLVTFMDADDLYPADYLALLCEKVAQLKADFYFAEVARFQSDKEAPIQTARAGGQADFVMPCSSAMTRAFGAWMGSPTSALAVTGRLFLSLFPFPHEHDWITRADDVIVFGSGVLGASKAYVPSVQVAYRVHGHNSFHGRRYSEAEKLRRQHRVDVLLGWYCQQCCLSPAVDVKRLLMEYVMVPRALHHRLQVPSSRRFLTVTQRLALSWRMRRRARRLDRDQRQ